MNQSLDIQELSIVLAVRNHNPTMLNLDFLRGSGVVGADWELAQQPVSNANAAQIAFKNGIKIEVPTRSF